MKTIAYSLLFRQFFALDSIVSAKQIESRILIAHAPIDISKVTSDNTVFNLTQSMPISSNTSTSAFATNRMKKPNQLITLSLENAIESGKTLIGQLDEQTDKKVQKGHAMCKDEKNQDYWSYQMIMSKDSSSSGYTIENMRPLKECLSNDQFKNSHDFIGINLSEDIISEPRAPKNQSTKMSLAQTQLSKEQLMIINKLSNVSEACKQGQCQFEAKEEKSHRGLDCISIFKHKDDPDNYYGLYHAMDASISNFNLYLAKSKNGVNNWEDIKLIDSYASQGRQWTNPNGNDIVVAYEQSNASFSGNSIRLKHYKDLDALKQGKAKDQLDLPNTLVEHCCEGTPSFENFERWNGDLKQSKFTLRLHYLMKADPNHDQQAFGHYDGLWKPKQENKVTVANFFTVSVPNFFKSLFQSNQEKSVSDSNQLSPSKNQSSLLTVEQKAPWTAVTLPQVSEQIASLGFHGNIGQRSKFTYNGEAYYIVEAQECYDCWDTWRIVLCDKNMSPLAILPIHGQKGDEKTGHSRTYANPFIGQIGSESHAVVSLFMPKEGNKDGEIGELIYHVNFDQV